MKKMDRIIMLLLVLFSIFVIAEMNKVMASFSSEFGQEWEKNYGGNYFDVGGCVFKTKDNGYIISGITETTYNSWDAWILKINDEGVMEWSNTFGGDGDDIGCRIIQTSDGGYIMVGIKNWLNNDDVWLLKLDRNGNYEWDKTYFEDEMAWGMSVYEMKDGYILAGFKDYDYFLMKIDKSGNVMWINTYGRKNDLEFAFHACKDKNGFAMVGIKYEEDALSGDVWLMKTDENGNEIWSRTYGGAGEDCGFFR